MSFIALEIDTDQILVAAAKHVGRGIEIQHAFALPLGDDSDSAVAETIKTELANRGLTRTDAIVVVNRSSVEIREIELPPAPDDELPDMVRLIARNEFASLNDNWLLDFLPLGSNPNLPRKVLATGLSPERHRQVSKIGELAGLKIKHVVLRPIASFDLLRPTLSGDGQRLVVDLGNSHTDLIVSSGGNVVATRTVRLPVVDDANQRNKTIVGEVKRTLASSAGSLGERPVSEIIVIGDSQRDETLATLLGEELSIDVKLVQPWNLVTATNKRNRPTDAARYSAVLGALVQQYSGARHPIDFLNPRRPAVKRNDRSRLYLYGGVAAAVALFALVFGWWTLRSQSREIAQRETELRVAVQRNKGENNQPGVEQTIGEVSRIDEWKMADVNWLEELYQYSDRFLTPDDAIVDSFDAGLVRTRPQIIVQSRTAGGKKESAVIAALDSRPYEVIPTKRGDSDEDASYPASFDFRVLLSDDRSGVTKEIDNKAAEFLQQRNATESSPATN